MFHVKHFLRRFIMNRKNLIRKYRKEYEKAEEAIRQAGLEPEDYISHIPKPGKTRKYNLRELNVYMRDLQAVNTPGGTDTITFRGSNVPKFYKNIYVRAKERYNRNTPFLQRMKLNKFKEPSADYSPFLDYSSKVIERGSPEYRLRREEQYKSNYLKAVKDSLSHTKKGKELYKLVKGINARKMIEVYNTKGNEDLGIINIYPGDSEQATLQSEYLIERWGQILSG